MDHPGPGNRPAPRASARGLTLLAVLALLACAAPGESREARRDARVGARLALASAGVIVGLMAPAHASTAAPARGACDSDVENDQRPALTIAISPVREFARQGLLDLPPPTA